MLLILLMCLDVPAVDVSCFFGLVSKALSGVHVVFRSVDVFLFFWRVVCFWSFCVLASLQFCGVVSLTFYV